MRQFQGWLWHFRNRSTCRCAVGHGENFFPHAPTGPIMDAMSTPRYYAEALTDFARAFQKAQQCRAIRDATAMMLATADRAAHPSVRTMLLKGVDARGVVVYTELDSRKGRMLRQNPRAALTFLWHPIGQQVHVEGRVASVSRLEADAYWATRPRETQIGAWASRQSHPLRSRAALLARLRAAERRVRSRLVPRPAMWSGFRVIPDRIEFWTEGAHRLHHRRLYARRGARWVKQLLYP